MKNNTKIMAIETSGRLGSVALSQGENLLVQQCFSGPLKHASELFPTIDSLCKQQGWAPSDIDHLYVSAGPGSFTGVRIAVTTAKTIGFAQDIKLIAVPSVEALALNAQRAEKEQGISVDNLAVILEAGRGNVFSAIFKKTDQSDTSSYVPGYELVMPATQIHPDELLAKTARPIYILGEGLNYHREQFQGDQIIWLDEPYWQGLAENVIRCGLLRAQAGLFEDPQLLQPVYLRRPEAEVKWDERHANS